MANGATTEFLFNASGVRVSEWNAATHTPLEGNYYWGGKPIAYYTTAADTGAAVGTHFEHQDYLGTERLRTNYNSANNPTYAVEATFAEQPFGDNKQQTLPGGADTDANHYAFLDTDKETATDHADFRQYSNAQGRWMAPDPYDGSYNPSNPQSLNRYVYAMDSPLSAIDPSGEDCAYRDETGNTQVYAGSCMGSYNNEHYIPKTGVTSAFIDPDNDLEYYSIGNQTYFTDGGKANTPGYDASNSGVYNGPRQPMYDNNSDTNQFMGDGVISSTGPSGGTNKISSDGSFSEAAFLKNVDAESAYLDFIATAAPPDMIADINQEIAIVTQIQKQVTTSCTAAGKAIQAWEKLYPGLPMPPALTNALASCSNH